MTHEKIEHALETLLNMVRRSYQSSPLPLAPQNSVTDMKIESPENVIDYIPADSGSFQFNRSDVTVLLEQENGGGEHVRATKKKARRKK